MRLRDIARVADEWADNLHFNTVEISNDVRITGFKKVVRATEAIHATGALTAETERILHMTDITRHVHDDAILRKELYEQFNSAVADLRIKAKALVSAIRSVLPPEEAQQVSVKLPAEDDLEDVSEILTELNKALRQALTNDFIKGDVKVIAFEPGSIWVDLFLGTTLAVTVLGRILKIICDYQLKQAQIAKEREVVRNLGLQNDVAAAAERTLEHRLALSLEVEVKTLAADAGAPTGDSEYIRRLEYSIKTLAALVQRGLEIRPALAAPAEVGESFPNPKEIAAAAALLSGPKRELNESRSASTT